ETSLAFLPISKRLRDELRIEPNQFVHLAPHGFNAFHTKSEMIELGRHRVVANEVLHAPGQNGERHAAIAEGPGARPIWGHNLEYGRVEFWTALRMPGAKCNVIDVSCCLPAALCKNVFCLPGISFRKVEDDHIRVVCTYSCIRTHRGALDPLERVVKVANSLE